MVNTTDPWTIPQLSEISGQLKFDFYDLQELEKGAGWLHLCHPLVISTLYTLFLITRCSMARKNLPAAGFEPGASSHTTKPVFAGLINFCFQFQVF